MSRLGFQPYFQVEILLPETVFLLGERAQHTLTGALYVQLAPLLDGSRTRDEIAAALDGQASPAQVGYALSRLLKSGYVVAMDDDNLTRDQAAYYATQLAAPRLIHEGKVAVHALGVDVAPMLDALASLGIGISDNEPHIDLVLVDDYLRPELDAINRHAQETGRAWLLVKPFGSVLWLGPLVMPDETACWECLAQRLRGNRAVEGFVERATGRDVPISTSVAALPTTLAMAFNLAANEVARWLGTGNNPLKNAVLTFDTLSLRTERHALLRRPQCPACGKPQVAQPKPITLQSRPRRPEVDGGYRSALAAETFARYRHHISPITGAVTKLEHVHAPELIHIYLAGMNWSRAFDGWSAVRRSLRSHSAGKGVEDIQARVSGLCEALERYSGVYRGDEARIVGCYAEIEGAVHPSDLLLYSDSQYAARDEWNATCPPHLEVKAPFDDTCPIAWTPVWSLGEQRFKYVPLAHCYYGCTPPDEPDFCNADSNGNAAGSSLEDATLQGFLEVVERDAISIWWDNRLRRPAIDLHSVDHPYLRRIEAYYRTIHRDVWALDLTTDFGIPVVVALSRRTDKPAEDIIMGFGAHLDARVALLRAVTELNQMLVSVITVGSDGKGSYNSESPWEIDWWTTASLASEPYLLPDVLLPARKIGDASSANGDLRDDVLACVDAAKRSGMDVLVLEQTRADIGLPVVKVIVPGMRHFWRRYAPGRLFDVPVQMGWLNAPTPESGLNPRLMTV